MDPDPGDEDDPITQNGYTYANNNPVMGVDSDGHFVWAVVNAGFAIYDGYKAYKAGKSKTEIKEIRYLKSRGYQLSKNGKKLVR